MMHASASPDLRAACRSVWVALFEGVAVAPGYAGLVGSDFATIGGETRRARRLIGPHLWEDIRQTLPEETVSSVTVGFPLR